MAEPTNKVTKTAAKHPLLTGGTSGVVGLLMGVLLMFLQQSPVTVETFKSYVVPLQKIYCSVDAEVRKGLRDSLSTEVADVSINCKADKVEGN